MFVLQYNPVKVPMEQIQDIFNSLRNVLPGGSIIALPEGLSLCEFTDEEIQEMYLKITKYLKERGILNDNN